MTFVLRMSSGMGSADLGKTSFSGVAATQGGFMFEAFLAFFFFNFFFKLYKIVLVLPNIKMNSPQLYMCSPS